MPLASKRQCFAPGCKTLVIKGYCSEHGGESYEARRPSARERGYDAKWEKFCRWFLRLAESVICWDCQRAPSTDVHHIKKLRLFPELKYEISNLMPLCKSCHSIRTARGE